MRSPIVLALVLVACGGSSPPPPSPTPGDAKPADTKPASSTAPAMDDAAKKQAALDQTAAEEAKTGQCTAENKAAFEKLIADYEAAAKGDPSEKQMIAFKTLSKKVLALGPSARGVEVSITGKGTELHVIAFGTKEISMDALAGTAAASTMRSYLAKASSAPKTVDLSSGKVELQNDSRVVTIKQGQPVQVKMTGQGCAAMIALVAP